MLVWPQVKPWVTRLATGELSLHRCEPIKATGHQGGASAPHFEVQQDSCSTGVIGDEIGALRIAEFFDRSEATKTFKRGMDVHNNPGFYRQLGKDPDLLLRAALELRARKSRRRRCHCENRPARSARCRMRPCKAASSVRLDMFGRGWSLAEELRKLLGFVRALAPPSKEADRGKQKAK